jgi:hypothetical protein
MNKTLLCFLFLLTTTAIWGQTKTLRIICKPPIHVIAGQAIKLQVKVAHQSKEEKTGTLTLSLYNKATGNSVDGWFLNIFPFQYFTTIDKENFEVEFPFTVPHEYKGSFDIELVTKMQDQKDSIRFNVITSSKK